MLVNFGLVNITYKLMYGKSLFRVASASSVRYKNDSTKKLLEFLADMPKANTARIADAQRQRQHISKKGEKYDKYGPSTVYLQVLGSGARGVPNTLYLFTDQKRYLFNCGECTQRLAHEHKVKLSKLDHIFITSKTWRNIGGLPGLSLTLQDVGVPKITLHGPDGLDELYNATKRFVIMKDMQVVMAKCSPSEDFEDSVMSVKYVLLAPSVSLLPKESPLKPAAKRPRMTEADKEFEEFVHDNTDYYKRDGKQPDVKKPRPVPLRTTERAPDPQKKKTEKVLMELQMKSHCSVAYICTLKKRLGTLDLAKCVEFGVKPGPMLGQLKMGHDVILPDGTLVQSKDVKTPDDPGPVFIVLDVPDISYLKEADFASHFADSDNPAENIPTLVVHMSPPSVYHHPAYRSFMARFGPGCRHLVLNAQNSCLGSEAVHRTQHKLHLLDADIFPLLRDASVPAEWSARPPPPSAGSPGRLKGFEDLKNRIAIAQFQNIINMESSLAGDEAPLAESASAAKLEAYSARTLTMFHLRPKKQLDRSAEPKLHVQEYYQEAMDVDGFVASLEQFRRLVDGVRYEKSTSMKEYPKIVFLGTGSCIPSKTRNTSAILLHIDEQSSILLDCGEGTFGQMVRFYGPRKVNEVLRTLKAIYISHLHADHHIGLIGVLQARFEAFLSEAEKSYPLYLMAPGQIVSWLTIYDQHFEKITNEFTLIPNQSLLEDAATRELSSANLLGMGVEAVTTCLVPHCPNAFGVALRVAGHKLTYSGDTLPTDHLVRIGKDSTILIHEATMEDELADEARMKMHSTTSQAIDIGRQMNAKFTVLTHFSQRYARLPRLNAHMLHDNNTVGIAFDNMQITMSDLELLAHMYAPLQLMFAEHCVEMELKAAHRERRRERRASSPCAAGGEGGKTPSERRAGGAPSPRGAASAPATRSVARYRESNASRLRQQSKGMAITGAIGPPRSKSSSRTKRPPGTRSADSNSTTPRNLSPDKAFGIDLIHTPRNTMSDSSSLSKDAQEFLRIVSNPPSCCVVDSRTAISVVTTGTANSAANLDESPPRQNPANVFVAQDSGYGKPLVTPINRKLTIRRDIMNLSPSRPVNKPPPNYLRGKRSPIRSWKAENSVEAPLKPTALANGGTATGAKSPTKSAVAGTKLRASSTNPNVRSDGKCPVKPAVPVTAPKTLSSSQVRFNKSPTRSLAEADPKPSQNKAKIQRSRDTRSWSPESSKIKNLNIPLRRSSKVLPVTTSNNKFTAKDTVKKSLPLKEHNIPKPCNRDIKQIPFAGKPSGGSFHGSRGFKPQLEDIKSSYLLLNKKNQECNKGANDVEKKCTLIKKPQPYNEKKRKEILTESKTKFKSKDFWNDSKYEKIEGLNWISWK